MSHYVPKGGSIIR